MTVSQLVAEYLLQRESEGCRPSTIAHYRSRLASLVKAQGDREFSSVQRAEILEWIRSATIGKAPDTIRSTSLAFGRLQQYAIDIEAIAAVICPVQLLPRPAGRRRTRLPSDVELRQILDIAPDAFAIIYRALVLTGARPSELVGGLIEQIEVSPAGRVLVLPEHKTSRKSKEPRRIPLGNQVAPWFDLAIGVRTQGRIFRDAHGQAWTVPKVSRVFRRLRRKMRLPEELVLYSARHRFGTEVVRKSGLYAAAALLGHSDVKTTQRYTHLAADELTNAQQIDINLDAA